MSEALHAVGQKGKAVLEAKDITVETLRTPPRELEHVRGINDIRIAVETSGLAVAFFYACWELGSFRWTYDIIPDAVFAVRVPERKTLLVEYDRGTETVRTVLEKLGRYEEILAGFPFRAVLVVTDTEVRLQDLGRHASTQHLEVPVYKSCLSDMETLGIRSPIFADLFNPRSVRVSLSDLLETRGLAERNLTAEKHP